MKWTPITIARSGRNFKWNIRKKGLWLLVILIMIMSAAGCNQTEKQDVDNQEQVKAVKVIKVTEAEKTSALNYIGTIGAKELVKYSFKMAGQIRKIYVAEGDKVNKGKKLAELDTTDLEFQLDSAKATMEMAAANVTKAKNALDYANSLYEKTVGLYNDGVVSKDAFEQVQLKRDIATTDFSQANSQYTNAQTDYNYKSELLNNSIIYVEQDGYVVQKVFNENERVGAYTPVIIVRSGAQMVNIGIPQQELSQITVGSKVNLSVDNDTAEGIITSISELPDVPTRTYKAEISVPDKTFRLGSIAKASVNIGNQNGIWIPMSSVFSDAGENCVYIIKDQRAFKRTVEIQNVSDDQVKVSGLANGELLAISGTNNLDDGTRVKVPDQE